MQPDRQVHRLRAEVGKVGPMHRGLAREFLKLLHVNLVVEHTESRSFLPII